MWKQLFSINQVLNSRNRINGRGPNLQCTESTVKIKQTWKRLFISCDNHFKIVAYIPTITKPLYKIIFSYSSYLVQESIKETASGRSFWQLLSIPCVKELSLAMFCLKVSLLSSNVKLLIKGLAAICRPFWCLLFLLHWTKHQWDIMYYIG